MALDTLGIQVPSLFIPEQQTVLYAYLREIFINETPLTTRLRRERGISEYYNIVVYDIRPLTYQIGAAIAATGTTTVINLGDVTPLLTGDVLEIPNTAGNAIERVEVVDNPVVAGATVTVKRGAEGTALVANDFTTGTFLTVQLIGNSRTGGEINQQGHRAIRTDIPQNIQTHQFPVQTGGKVMAMRNIQLPAGFNDVFTLDQKVAMTEMMISQEVAHYYGIGEKATVAGQRAKESGLKKLIGYYKSPDGGVTAGPNVKVALGGSFTRQNMITSLQTAIDGGGRPDVIVCSTDFFGAISTWSLGNQFYVQGTNKIGMAIDGFLTAFLGRPIMFVPSFRLRKGTFMGLTWDDVLIRELRPEQFIQRGVLGDAMQGDMLCDTCIEIGHPGWHCWGEGITSYA